MKKPNRSLSEQGSCIYSESNDVHNCRMAERHFSEKEVSALIKRATELQAGNQDLKTDQPTLTQVQQAAGELGILPQFLASAAVELESNSRRKGFWGGPVAVRRSTKVSGRLSPEQG